MLRKFTPYLCGAYFSAAVLIAASLPFLTEDGAMPLYAPCVLSALALLVLHVGIVWPRPQGAIASTHVLLPVVYFAVHFSYQLCVLCGMREFFDHEYIEAGSHFRATVLCLSGFLMLLSGLMHGYSPVAPLSSSGATALQNEDSLNKATLWIVGICMLLMTGLAIAGGFGVLLTMPYAHPDTVGVVGRLYEAVQKVFTIALLLSMATLRRGLGFTAYAIPGVCAGIWFLFWSLVGLRGHTQVFLLGMLIAWSTRIRPLSRTTIAVGCAAALLSWLVIGQARHRSTHGEGLAQMAPLETIALLVTQPGQIITTVDRALDLHPADEPYRYGLTYLSSLRYAFPNIGGGERSQFEGYADWMADYYSLPNGLGGTKGLGSSPLTEAYANFSVFGVFVLFLIGLAAAKLETRAIVLRRSPAVFYYTLFSVVMVWSMRNDSLSWGRWFVWSYIVWISAVRLSAHLPRTQRQGREPSFSC